MNQSLEIYAELCQWAVSRILRNYWLLVTLVCCYFPNVDNCNMFVWTSDIKNTHIFTFMATPYSFWLITWICFLPNWSYASCQFWGVCRWLLHIGEFEVLYNLLTLLSDRVRSGASILAEMLANWAPRHFIQRSNNDRNFFLTDDGACCSQRSLFTHPDPKVCCQLGFPMLNDMFFYAMMCVDPHQLPRNMIKPRHHVKNPVI